MAPGGVVLHMALSGVDHSSHARPPLSQDVCRPPHSFARLGRHNHGGPVRFADLQPRKNQAMGCPLSRTPASDKAVSLPLACLGPNKWWVRPRCRACLFTRILFPRPSFACVLANLLIRSPPRSLNHSVKTLLVNWTVLSFVSVSWLRQKKKSIVILLITLGTDSSFLRRRSPTLPSK